MNNNDNIIPSVSKLKPIVENIACEEVNDFDVINVDRNIKAGFLGISGDKAVITIRYTTCSGKTETKTVFVKRFYEPEAIREAWHYMALKKTNAPIPEFYGSLNIERVNEREIIFLEHISPVLDYRPYCDFVNDKSKYTQFIKVTARLDSIIPSDDYASILNISYPQDLFDNSIKHCITCFERLWDNASDGKLGEDIKHICTDKAFISIKSIPERLINIDFAPYNHLEHDCYEPCHTGWRNNTGEMLIFDFAGSMLGTRFCNGSIWLGEPDEVRPKCYSRNDLAVIYLKEYTKFVGEAVSLEQFLRESREQWLCHSMWLIDLWYRNILNGEDEYKGLLYRLIRFLISF